MIHLTRLLHVIHFRMRFHNSFTFNFYESFISHKTVHNSFHLTCFFNPWLISFHMWILDMIHLFSHNNSLSLLYTNLFFISSPSGPFSNPFSIHLSCLLISFLQLPSLFSFFLSSRFFPCVQISSVLFFFSNHRSLILHHSMVRYSPDLSSKIKNVSFLSF